MDKKRFIVEGMSCSACENSVKRAVLRVDGVKDVNVSLLDKSMEVEFDEKADINKINKAVKKAGYKSYLDENGYEDNDNEVKIMAIRLISSFVLLIFLFYISMGHMIGWNIGIFKERLILLAVVECILALALMIINHKFFVSSFYAIKNRSLNMDVLVALGSSVSFIYGFVVMIIMIINKDSASIVHISHNLTFETAGMVPTLITIGKFLEALSKKKTKNALKDLLDMSPKYANIIKDGKEIKVKIEEVVKGDIFIVKPGESVAVDGCVIEGYSTIDESMLSGESMPVDKKTGDLVYQATINQAGNIKCEALKVGNDTSFSKIIALVKEASSSKAKISRIVDKVASIFVPFIILISLIVFITWIIILNTTSININESTFTYAIMRACSVLVISCPCALGLATPVAIMVGTGKGAKMGILYKKATAIEECGKIDYVLLDKTGTITQGRPYVTEVISKIDEEEFLILAKSVEKLSSHPLSYAVMEYKNEINDKLYDANDFETLVGSGIRANILGKSIKALKYDESIDIERRDKDKILSLEKEGKTILVFIYDEKVIGIIAVSDKIKETSKDAISKLKDMNINVAMLTGDNDITASYIASIIGIDYVGKMMPEDKSKYIEKIKEKHKVAMIGDGINDAIALKKADVGIAIGSGTDVAIDSADIVLVRSDLDDAVNAILFSKKVLKNIKENLFWAFFYNLIMIPIASGALTFTGVSFLMEMRPWYGALAMSLSSIFVVLNALRLNLYKPK